MQAAGFRTFGVGVGRVRVRLLAALERAGLAPKHVPWYADRLPPYSDGSFPLNFGRFPLTAHSRLITADSRFPLTNGPFPLAADSRLRPIPTYQWPIPTCGRFPLTALLVIL